MANDDVDKSLAYFAVGGYYDHQRVRLAHMNRCRDIIRKLNEGIPLDQTEPKKEDGDATRFAKKYRDENLGLLLDTMVEEKKITTDQVAHIRKLLAIVDAEAGLEAQYRDIVKAFVVSRPMYQEYLGKIKGLKGPLLAGALLVWFDPYRAKHISSFWKFAGLHVVEGHGVKRRAGEKLDFNPKVRVLMFKVADSFIKQRTQPYRRIYDETKAVEKARLKDTEKGWKGHADARAKRRMLKAFLADFWLKWRTMEGLPVSAPYSVRFHPGGEDEWRPESA